MPIDLPCTGCRRRLSVRDEFAGRQVRCPGCGAMVYAVPPAPPSTGSLLPGYQGPFFGPPPVEPQADPPAPGRARSALLLSPSAFFARHAARSTPARAAGVGLPFLLLGVVATTIQSWLILRRIGPWVAESWTSAGLGKPPFDASPSFGSIVQGQLALEAMGLLLFPLALHLGFMTVGARGLSKTLSIYFYSLCGRILDLLPFGFLFSMIYVLVLNYLGARHAHGLSEGKALGAILLAVGVGLIALLILLSAIALLCNISSDRPG